MVEQVELEFDERVSCGYGLGGEAPWREVEWRVPPVVELGVKRHADLADDLGVEVQGPLGVLPGGERQLG